jgi:hypothetical protein
LLKYYEKGDGPGEFSTFEHYKNLAFLFLHKYTYVDNGLLFQKKIMFGQHFGQVLEGKGQFFSQKN